MSFSSISPVGNRMPHRLAMLLLVLGWFACGASPLLAQKQDFREQILKVMFPKVRGKVTADEAKVNWNDPIRLKNLMVWDNDGHVLLTVEEFSVNRSLSQMVFNPKDRGAVKLVRPQAFVNFHDNGCNFIDVLGEWYAQETAGRDPADMQLEIVQGTLHLIDEARSLQVMIEPLDFSCLPVDKEPKNRAFQLSVQLPWQRLRFACAGKFDRQADTIQFADLQAEHTPTKLGFVLAGTLRDLKAKPVLQLEGQWQYDPQWVVAVLRAQGQDVEIRSNGVQPLRIDVQIGELMRSLQNPTAWSQPAPAADPGPVGPAAPWQPALPSLGTPASYKSPAGTAAQVAQQPAPVQPPQQIQAQQVQAPQAQPPQPMLPELGNAPAPVAGLALPNAAEAPVGHPLQYVRVETAVGWEAARHGHLIAGPATYPLVLADGLLTLAPSRMILNDGWFQLGATVDLRQPEPAVQIMPGLILDQVVLTPEMCHNALVMVAPMVADAGVIQGRISMKLLSATIPLADPKQANVQGELFVHGIQLDLAEQFAKWAVRLGMSPRLRLLDESLTHFQFVDQRMHHQGMGFVLGDKLLWTSGSVGLDRTLDLVAEISLPLSWLPNGPLGQRLKGTRIRIPIRGTFDHPDIGGPEFPDLALSGIGQDGPLGNFLRRMEDPQAPPLQIGRPGGLIDRIRGRVRGAP